MIQYITGNTVANTVRMAARSRRPKAIFLASDEADLELVQTLFAKENCRIIPAHTRRNAVHAFDLLMRSGYQGVFTTVNTHFSPPTEREILGSAEKPQDILGIEGVWEDVRRHGSMLAGHRVQVIVVDESETPLTSVVSAIGCRAPNAAMLKLLSEIGEIRKSMDPKRDQKDYLREARAGAMYGFGDD
jgi:hypothetical protein